MRARGAVACEYSTSSAISSEFWLLNLQPTELPGPVQTWLLPAGRPGRPHCVEKAALSLSFQAYAPAMTIVSPVPSKPVALA
jgi:hypothetical protein